MDYKDYKKNKKSKNLHFWYQARKNLILLLLKKTLKTDPKNNKILNIGCGTGTELSELINFGKLTVLDINKKALEKINYPCKKINADIENYNLENNKFDLICCFDVLEHLNNDSLVLNKINKALKNNAYFIFTIPAYQFLFSTHDIAMEHKRRYSKKKINQKISNANFKIIHLAYWNSILFPLISIYRIIKKILYKKNLIQKPSTDNKPLNKFLNLFLFHLLNTENKKLFFQKMPFGLSIHGIAKKK